MIVKVKSQLTHILSIILLSLVLVKGENSYFVDPRGVLVNNFEGWGTSLAWWADILGGMNQEVIDSVTDAFFSVDHLNLNIVRYVLGGTSKPNETGDFPCGPFRPGGGSESFKDSADSDYDWTRDPRQIKILRTAIEKGVDTLEAFSNSPPEWLTISGCSKGNSENFPLHDNMGIGNSISFAEYAADVISHFHENMNITFSTYVPFNEPSGLLGIGAWSGPGQSQEGCNMKLNVMNQIVQDMYTVFNERNMNYVSLSAADETQINQAILTSNYFRENNVTQLIEKVNVHGYWDNFNLNRRDLLSMHTTADGHRLWMDEMGWAGTSDGNMGQALEIANRIVIDLRNMMPSAWLYWQVMEEPGLWGLLELPYNNPTVADIKYNSGFYAMKQFSKFIKKGSTLIQINNPNAVAAFNKEEEELVIVIINPTNETLVSETVDFQLFEVLGSEVTIIRTSPEENAVEVESGDIFVEPKQLVYDVPPQSITTFIVHDAIFVEGSDVGLVFASTFETTADQQEWKLNDGWEKPESDAYAIKGKYSGYLPSGTLSRSIQAPVNGDYYLTAWCSSLGTGTEIKVAVSGEVKASLLISGGETFQRYNSYGLTFSALKDEEINILLTGQSESYIDEVILSFIPTEPNSSDNSSVILRAPLSVSCILVIYLLYFRKLIFY